jgi:hypothetical protein
MRSERHFGSLNRSSARSTLPARVLAFFFFVDGKTFAASNPLDVEWMWEGERAVTSQGTSPAPVASPGVLTTGGIVWCCK